MRRYVAALFGVVLLLGVPLLVSSQYLLTLINVAGVNMMLALGLLFLFGFCGQLSFCQAAFFAIGAYTSAILATKFELNVWLSMLCGTLAAGVFSAIVGIAILRLRSHYFALATLGLTQIVSQILLNWKVVTGGTDGIVKIPKPTILGWPLDSMTAFYYLILATVTMSALVAHHVRHSRYWRSFVAVRSDALAAEIAGLNVFATKLLAFILSAVYAGIGGALYAHMISFISPDAFDLVVSVNAFAMVLVGGTAKIWGVLVGSALVTCLPELLRFTHQYYMLLYGIGIALVVMFLPGGLSGYVRARNGPDLRVDSVALADAASKRASKPSSL